MRTLDRNAAQKVAEEVVIDRLYGCREASGGVGPIVAGFVGVLGGDGEGEVQVGHDTTPFEGDEVGNGLWPFELPNVATGQTAAYKIAPRIASRTASRSTVTRVAIVTSPSPTALA